MKPAKSKPIRVR